MWASGDSDSIKYWEAENSTAFEGFQALSARPAGKRYVEGKVKR